jgi:hypothetical protein
MRILLILAILPIGLLSPGTAAAEDPEDPYFVRVTPHDPELPAERDPSYDCAGEDGPEGAVESAKHNADGLTDGERWGLPYVAPDCLAADARADDAKAPDPPTPTRACRQIIEFRSLPMRAATLAMDPCRVKRIDSMATGPATTSGSEGGSARATYNLSSGRYSVHLDPALQPPPLWAPFSAAVLMFPLNVSGNSGVSVQFDCVECPPPWEQ